MAVREPHPAQRVVHGVGDQDVVVEVGTQLGRDQAQPVGLAEPGVVGPAVDEPALAGPDAPDERLAVGQELGERVVTRVRDQEVASRERDRLGGEAQRARRRGGRHVDVVAPRGEGPQRALGAVLLHELVDERGERRRVPLARHLRDDVALGVDHDERRPGPRGVRGPGDELGVVEDGVTHLVALDRGSERDRVCLVLELRGVDADDDEVVAARLLELAQLVEDVQAVDAAERPEVEDDDPAAQVRERDVAAARVEPAAPDELGGADAGQAGVGGRGAHPRILPQSARLPGPRVLASRSPIPRGGVMADDPARKVSLRTLREDDLPTLFEIQLDARAQHLAAFTDATAGDRDAYLAKFRRILADAAIVSRVVEVDGVVVGSAAVFPIEGDTEVTYWIQRDWWGRGVASAALAALLAEVPARPLQARVAEDNLGSLRVLERNGFVRVGSEDSFAPARDATITELILELPA
ncbi:hypothetical protein D3C74_298580 [compost metagenome]